MNSLCLKLFQASLHTFTSYPCEGFATRSVLGRGWDLFPRCFVLDTILSDLCVQWSTQPGTYTVFMAVWVNCMTFTLIIHFSLQTESWKSHFCIAELCWLEVWSLFLGLWLISLNNRIFINFRHCHCVHNEYKACRINIFFKRKLAKTIFK